jgi:hypothetical protein
VPEEVQRKRKEETKQTFSSNGEKNWTLSVPILRIHIVALGKGIGGIVVKVIDFGIKNQSLR